MMSPLSRQSCGDDEKRATTLDRASAIIAGEGWLLVLAGEGWRHRLLGVGDPPLSPWRSSSSCVVWAPSLPPMSMEIDPANVKNLQKNMAIWRSIRHDHDTASSTFPSNRRHPHPVPRLRPRPVQKFLQRPAVHSFWKETTIGLALEPTPPRTAKTGLFYEVDGLLWFFAPTAKIGLLQSTFWGPHAAFFWPVNALRHHHNDRKSAQRRRASSSWPGRTALSTSGITHARPVRRAPPLLTANSGKRQDTSVNKAVRQGHRRLIMQASRPQ
jgi:hypothetical protein